MTNEQKALAIIREIAQRGEKEGESCIVAFYPDWGNNSLTVQIGSEGHTHVGNCANTEPTEENFSLMLDNLYRLLCKDGEGCLSLAQPLSA